MFEPHPDPDAETYRLDGDRVDLEPMVRDAVLLALPLAPLCATTARAPTRRAPVVVEGGRRRRQPAPDPRWAALGELRFD